MALRLRRKWPRVDLFEPGGRGDIKTLSAEDLERLMTTAQGRWSAMGRPRWFASERESVLQIMMVVTGAEEPSVYRCIVTVIVKGEGEGAGSFTGNSFTLDVSRKDFDDLRDISDQTLVGLAHHYLADFPMLALDPGQ
jgi:hypothetical protein